MIGVEPRRIRALYPARNHRPGPQPGRRGVVAHQYRDRCVHAWNCSGAPIFDPQGAVWACIDISGPVGADHALAFDLVIGAARALERQLFQAYLADIENKSRSMPWVPA